MGWFGPSGDCGCCSPQVLLWDYNRASGKTDLSACKTVYDSLGITAHLPASFTGDIDDYFCIIMLWPEGDPSWLADLASWAGRLFIAGDYHRPDTPPHGAPAANAWINALASTYSVGISIDGVVIASTFFNRSVTNDLTSTQAILHGDLFSTVTGHTALYETGADVVMRRRTLSGIDWLIHGDGTSLVAAGGVSSNANFLEKIALEPVP